MFKYIYYSLYKIAKKTEKSWTEHMKMPAFIAMITISIVQFINLLTVYVLSVHGLKLLKLPALSKEMVIFLGAVLYATNYFLYIKDKKFLSIEKRFDQDSNRAKVIKRVLFWIYLVGSFILLFFMLENFKTVSR